MAMAPESPAASFEEVFSRLEPQLKLLLQAHRRELASAREDAAAAAAPPSGRSSDSSPSEEDPVSDESLPTPVDITVVPTPSLSNRRKTAHGLPLQHRLGPVLSLRKSRTSEVVPGFSAVLPGDSQPCAPVRRSSLAPPLPSNSLPKLPGMPQDAGEACSQEPSDNFADQPQSPSRQATSQLSGISFSSRPSGVKEATLHTSWDVEVQQTMAMGCSYSIEAGNMTSERSDSGVFVNPSPSWRRPKGVRRLFGLKVVHPQSIPRLCFDIVALFITVYDIAMIPVYLAFEISSDSIMDGMEYVTVLFWTLDMLLSFNTGYNTSDGCLIMKRKQVALHYLSTWFSVDLCVVLPELLLVMDVSSGGGLGALKVLRFLRVMRLLRLIKFDKILKDLKARINSNPFLLTMAILKHIFCLLLLIHIIACLWYGLGTRPNGWVVALDLAESALWHRYLCALHWSLTQFHGSTNINPINAEERFLAVVVLFMALVLFSSFLSSVTNLMMQLSSLRQERTVHLQALYGYLEHRGISSELSVRVKKYVEATGGQSQQEEQDVELLRLLPKQLLMDLHDESRSPALVGNPFLLQLKEKHPRVLRQLCHEAVVQGFFESDDVIFAKGDCTQRLYCLEMGLSRYHLGGRIKQRRDGGRRTMQGLRGQTLTSMSSECVNCGDSWNSFMQKAVPRTVSQILGKVAKEEPGTPDSRVSGTDSMLVTELTKGRSLAEASLWTRWEHKGDLEAISFSSVLMVNVKDFQRVVEAYEVALLECALYAKAFLEVLNQSSLLSDLMEFRVTRRSHVFH